MNWCRSASAAVTIVAADQTAPPLYSRGLVL